MVKKAYRGKNLYMTKKAQKPLMKIGITRYADEKMHPRKYASKEKKRTGNETHAQSHMP